MTKQIKTSIIINASSERVWEILMDIEKYPQWNPFIKSIVGDIKVGNQIQVKMQGMMFKPKILTVTKNKELKWLGHFWFKGLFDGEHRFYITDNGDETTHFEQSEIFTGILVKLFSKKLYTKTKQGFEQMNKELKLCAEKSK